MKQVLSEFVISVITLSVFCGIFELLLPAGACKRSAVCAISLVFIACVAELVAAVILN